MTIRRDASDASIVLTCSECSGWAALSIDPLESYRIAEDHDIRVHDVEPARAERARLLFETRRGRKILNVS